MRILLIRQGDPDYEHDTLTEKGHREAALFAESYSSAVSKLKGDIVQ